MTKPNVPQRRDVMLLASLYVAQFAALLAILSVHRKGDRALSAWILSTPGLTFLVAVAVLLGTVAWIGRQYLRSRGSGSPWFGLMVAMNLITLAFILIPIEIAVRLLSRDTWDAPILIDTVLLPRSWEKAAEHNSRIVDKASGELSYLVYDEVTGWTVGPNRRSANGLYLSSAEGLRAGSQGAVLAGPKTKHRVALVGDSFVFAERVAFEDSWGHVLERDSNGTLQVLNFGVGGYGVDQSYLRFKQEVLAWKPDVAILGFPWHDLLRTITVYPFINWPDWGIPFSKPRLVLDAGELRTLNIPTIPPQKMYSMGSISQLPFLEYDLGYRQDQWEWNITDASYAKRWLFASFPRFASRSSHLSDDELIRLNAAILRTFVKLASEQGIVPVIAFFPDRPQITRLMRGEQAEAQRALKRLDVPVVDTTACVLEVGAQDAYVAGDPHYSPRGNSAVAKCKGRALEPILAARNPAEASTAGEKDRAR